MAAFLNVDNTVKGAVMDRNHDVVFCLSSKHNRFFIIHNLLVESEGDFFFQLVA